jgi:flagellar biogenesis protein FliO
MAVRLQRWFARQPLTVKLLVTVPLLLGALFWSTLPGNNSRTPDPGNQPVLSGANSRGALDATTASASPAAPTLSGGAPAASTVQPEQPAANQPLLPHQEPRPTDAGLDWSTALRTLVSIGVVIVLILLSAQGLKYIMAGATQPLRTANRTINVLESLHLPAPSGRGRSAVHLLEVGEQVLLIGATDAQLTLLAEFPDDDAARLRRPASTSATAGPVVERSSNGSFAQTLAAAEGATIEPSGSGVSAGAETHIQSPPVPPDVHGTNGALFDDAALTQLLRRLRESKQRLEAEY